MKLNGFAVTDPHASPSQQRAGASVLPRHDSVDDHIQTSWLGSPDDVDEVLRAVVDRDSPVLPEHGMLAGGGQTVHAQPCQSAQLQQRGPDAAAGPDEQDLVAIGHPSGAMQHLVGHQVVEDQWDGLRRVQPGGDWDQAVSADIGEFGVATVDGQGGDPITLRNSGDT